MLRSSRYPILYTVPALKTLHGPGGAFRARFRSNVSRLGGAIGEGAPRGFSGQKTTSDFSIDFFPEPPNDITNYTIASGRNQGLGYENLKIALPEAWGADIDDKRGPRHRFSLFPRFGAFLFVLPPEKGYSEPGNRALSGAK